MKIAMFKHRISTGAICEERELELGKYNEFYLPSLGRDWDMFVIITDDDGEETKLHLKR